MTMEDMTLLHHVAFDGQLEVLEMLKTLPQFKEVADVDNNEVKTISFIFEQIGWTPILWAAARGELEIMQSLVDGGAQILKPRKDGVTVLHLAVVNNDVHVLNYACKIRQT